MQRKNKHIEKHVLVNDPSIRAWGWAVLDYDGFVVAHGCIKTETSNKKLRIRKGDDRVRRISELNQALLAAIRKYNVTFLISELPHGSQSASAAVMVGITTAIMQTISDTLDIGLEWYSEADAKRCALGKNSASKDEMINRMNEIYDVDWYNVKYKDEAVADALAIHYVATKQSSTLKMLKK